MAPFVRLYKFGYTTPIEAMINAHYHYIKISLCVHVCVSDRSMMFGGTGVDWSCITFALAILCSVCGAVWE